MWNLASQETVTIPSPWPSKNVRGKNACITRHGKLVMEWNLQKMDGPDRFFNHCKKELNIHEVHLLRTDVIRVPNILDRNSENAQLFNDFKETSHEGQEESGDEDSTSHYYRFLSIFH